MLSLISNFEIVFSDYYPGGWIICPYIHDAVEQSFVHVPIMGFRKFVLIHSFVNVSFRFNSREGQVVDDSIFLGGFPLLVDAGLVG